MLRSKKWPASRGGERPSAEQQESDEKRARQRRILQFAGGFVTRTCDHSSLVTAQTDPRTRAPASPRAASRSLHTSQIAFCCFGREDAREVRAELRFEQRDAVLAAAAVADRVFDADFRRAACRP